MPAKLIVIIFTFCFSISNSMAETLAGPRLGITYLSQGMIDLAEDEGVSVEPVITQFGWQFEKKFLTTKSGPEGITALIPLIGGIEQGLFIPSLTWLTGLRLENGYEFGVGPNISVGTSGMAFVFGHTSKHGELFIPKNIGFLVSKDGLRVSFMFGFNSRFEK